MARERGLSVDTAGFEKLMDEQRARARAAQKKEVIDCCAHLASANAHESLSASIRGKPRLHSSSHAEGQALLDNVTVYAEMGGQVVTLRL
jgi:alanyl-tRNA synthetase